MKKLVTIIMIAMTICGIAINSTSAETPMDFKDMYECMDKMGYTYYEIDNDVFMGYIRNDDQEGAVNYIRQAIELDSEEDIMVLYTVYELDGCLLGLVYNSAEKVLAKEYRTIIRVVLIKLV